LRLGAIGFGGPIALIALMERECSARRAWISADEFNERYVFAKLLPGPIAYQMALWMGYHVRGRVGGLIAGVALLLPALLLIALLSASYTHFVGTPTLAPFITGMEVGALIVILDSLWRMFQPYRQQRHAWCFILITAPLMLVIPRWEPVIIMAGGALMIVLRTQRCQAGKLFSFAALPLATLAKLFWVHCKAGFTVFGTGLAIIPALQHEVVERYHWLTNTEFLDGIAFGQITPGPVTITSVFVGYKTAGWFGALAGFLGMYSPGILLILFVMPLLFEKMKGHPWLAHFQAGAIPSVIGCILGATLLLGQMIIVTPTLTILLLVLGLIAYTTRAPSWAIIALGSALGGLWPLLTTCLAPR